MRRLFFLSIFFALPFTKISAQTAEQILEKYFDAIGGQENLRNFTASSGEDISIQYYPKRDTTFNRNISKAPYSFNYKTYKKNDLLSEAFGNGEGITHFSYMPYPMKIERERHKVEISIAHQILYAMEKRKVKRLSDTTINASPAFAIKCKLSKKGSPLNKTYFFDQTSFMLIGLSSESLKGHLTFFESYTPTGNLLLPTRTRYELNGTLLHETVVKRLEINPSLPDSLFTPKEYVPAKTKFRLNSKVEFLDAKLGDLDFQQFIKTFNGKAVLIDLWASWCGPCKYEFAKYDDVYFHFLMSKNIQTVFISVDKPEKEADWKKSINHFALSGSHLRAGKKLYQSIQKQFYKDGVVYIPRLILVGKDGEILSAELPKLSSGMFYTKVDELVK